MDKIINILNNFGNYYMNFINNHELKIELLTNENVELGF